MKTDIIILFKIVLYFMFIIICPTYEWTELCCELKSPCQDFFPVFFLFAYDKCAYMYVL